MQACCSGCMETPYGTIQDTKVYMCVSWGSRLRSHRLISGKHAYNHSYIYAFTDIPTPRGTLSGIGELRQETKNREG